MSCQIALIHSPSYQIWTLGPSHWFSSYCLKVSFCYLLPFLLLLFLFHHLSYPFNEWTMLSKSQIIFILLLFYSRITQVSSFHKIIQISLCISHLHRGHHSGNRSLYLFLSYSWFHFYKSQVLTLWRIISYFYLLLHSVILSYTSYHPQNTSIPLPSYQIGT